MLCTQNPSQILWKPTKASRTQWQPFFAGYLPSLNRSCGHKTNVDRGHYTFWTARSRHRQPNGPSIKDICKIFELLEPPTTQTTYQFLSRFGNPQPTNPQGGHPLWIVPNPAQPSSQRTQLPIEICITGFEFQAINLSPVDIILRAAVGRLVSSREG